MGTTGYIIVGQGLAGTMLSYHMYKQGIDHRVISASSWPSSSMVAAGMYNPLVFKRVTKSWMIDELLPYMNQVYKDMEKWLGEKLLFPKTVAKLIKNTDLAYWKERIETQGLHQYIGSFKKDFFINDLPESHHVAFVKGSGFIKTALLLTSYQQFLSSREYLIDEQFDFLHFKAGPDGVQYKNHFAKAVVFCEGALATQNPYFADLIPFYLTRGDLIRLEIHDFQHEYIFNKDFFLLPLEDSYVLGSTYKRITEPDYHVQEAEKQLLLSRFEKVITKPYKILRHTVGVRPTMKDRRPVLGSHPKYPNLYVFNGLGTKGVMLAPYFAREMLHKLMDPGYILSPEIDLQRFL